MGLALLCLVRYVHAYTQLRTTQIGLGAGAVPEWRGVMVRSCKAGCRPGGWGEAGRGSLVDSRVSYPSPPSYTSFLSIHDT